LAERQSLEIVPLEVIADFLSDLTALISNPPDSVTQVASVQSLSEIYRFKAISRSVTLPSADFEMIIDKLMSLSKEGNDDALLALSAMSLAFEEDLELLSKTLRTIYDAQETRQTESLLASGEALACVTAGFESKAMIKYLDIPGSSPPKSKRHGRVLTDVLSEVLDFTRSPKNSLRKVCYTTGLLNHV
jgi:hypothetical protein